GAAHHHQHAAGAAAGISARGGQSVGGNLGRRQEDRNHARGQAPAGRGRYAQDRVQESVLSNRDPRDHGAARRNHQSARVFEAGGGGCATRAEPVKRLAALVILCALAAPAAARMIVHTVKPGDTLEVLAAEYYGNRQNAVYIMAANNMTHPRALRTGLRLKIPTAWHYKLKKGETLEHVAELYMGDKRRAPFLAEFSGYRSAEDVRPGQDIVIPFHLTHQATATETLGMVAAALLGDSKKADLLRRYNFRQGMQLARGERIVVPITHVKVRESNMPK